MSVSDNYTPDRSIGNGVTTVFSGDWAALSTDWFYAQLEDIETGARTDLTQGVDYTVSFSQSGYVLTMTTAPTAAQALIRYRQTPIDQTNPYTTAKGFQGKVVEDSFDKTAQIDQELADSAARALKFRVGDNVPDIFISAPVDGRSFKYDEAAGLFVPTDSDPDDVTAAAQQYADAAAASAADSAAGRAGSEMARDEAVAAKEEVEEALQSLTQATETVSGISRQATLEEATSGTSTTPEAKPHVTPEGLAAARWNSRAIGERFAIQTHLVGAETPPNVEGGPRFIKLTAGDAYNAGLLSGETVSGTWPAITATAVVALAESPMYGQTVHLLNTEGRFPRPGASGELADSAIAAHQHKLVAAGDGTAGKYLASAAVGGTGGYRLIDTTTDTPPSRGAYIGDVLGATTDPVETRPRNIAETNYMRIF